LTSLISSGQLPAKVFRRATALLELSRGKSLVEVAQTLSVTYQTVASWRDSYHEHGLGALQDKERSGRPIRIDGAQRAKITALACSTPPEGRARWSLRLLADKAVELGYCERLSHHAVKEVLKKTR
jgi:transposase